MPEGREGMGSIQEETTVENDAVETETQETESQAPESARESAEKALRELQAQVQDGSGEEGAGNGETEAAQGEKVEIKLTPEVERPEKAPKQPKIAKVKEEPAEDLRPPERLNAKEKEVYNKAPKELKKAISRMVNDHQAQFTRTQQEMAHKTQESADIMAAVKPYIHEWGASGITVPQGIAALCAAQSKLTNPETAVDTYVSMGADMGINFDKLAQYVAQKQGRSAEGTSNPSADISSHPDYVRLKNEFLDLRKKVDPILSDHEAAKSHEEEAAVNDIVSQFKAVKDEMDPVTGQYRYPMLHEDGYIETVKPLVSALVRTVPSLSYGEALKRAIAQKEGNSFQTNQTRLPASNNNINQRAQTANLSVRGRNANVGVSSAGALPAEALSADPRDTVRWALESLRRGG